MGRDRYVVFEETTPWPSWVALLVYGAGWLSAGGVLAQLWRGREGAVRFGAVAGAALLAAGPLVLQGVFGRLRVQVTRTSLLISFGYLRLISKLVPFTEIRDLEAVKYGPLREFGGWGIRWSFRKTAWTIRGDRALRLTLENGRSLYVGLRARFGWRRGCDRRLEIDSARDQRVSARRSRCPRRTQNELG